MQSLRECSWDKRSSSTLYLRGCCSEQYVSAPLFQVDWISDFGVLLCSFGMGAVACVKTARTVSCLERSAKQQFWFCRLREVQYAFSHEPLRAPWSDVACRAHFDRRFSQPFSSGMTWAARISDVEFSSSLVKTGIPWSATADGADTGARLIAIIRAAGVPTCAFRPAALLGKSTDNSPGS